MKRILKCILTGLIVVLSVRLITVGGAAPQNESAKSKPLVLSVQMERGKPLYKLDGKIVEDRRENSLLSNLLRTAKERGSQYPVLIIVDERAPFTEANKLQTALDKIDMPNRKLFVADFVDGTMNEIHLEVSSIPIPKN